MSRIWGMMDVGKRSLMNSKSALQTVSHNIANKDTEGYSRQRVDQQTNPPVGFGKLRIGTGARAVRVKRVNNPYLEKQLENEKGLLGNHQGKMDVLHRVESVFNEQIYKGLNKFMSEFFNSYRELSNNPESLAIRDAVKETADNLTEDIHRVHNHLVEIQSDADFQIGAHVEEINRITREIASLNEKVQVVELQGIEANDERDRRDLLIKNLGELINIRYGEGETGDVTITAGDTAVIVSGHTSIDLFATRTEEREGKREGNYDVFYKYKGFHEPLRVTKQIRGGRMGGLIEIRDRVINDALGRMDNLSFTLANEVNKAHVLGVDRYNQKGQEFFETPTGVKNASQNIRVSQKILEDVGRIVAGASPNSPGDNRVANVIGQIQYKKTIPGEDATLDEYYKTLVSQIGIKTNRTRSDLESQKDIVKQLTNIRESISGVSLDEETTKMIEYQKSFDASARLIRTADEMMETVLNLKRY